MHHDIRTIVDHLSRKYRIENICAEPGEDTLKIVELDRKEREALDAKNWSPHDWDYRMTGRPKDLVGGTWNVFRHLWPFEGDKEWREVWRSWPLVGLEDAESHG